MTPMAMVCLTLPALMTLYDDAPVELKRSLERYSIEISTYSDQWGSFISAYAPFYSNEGDFAGVLVWIWK